MPAAPRNAVQHHVARLRTALGQETIVASPDGYALMDATVDARWDVYVDRMQVKAAARTGIARERAEAAIADLRQRRISIGTRFSNVGTAASEGRRDAKTRALADLDELKAKADAPIW